MKDGHSQRGGLRWYEILYALVLLILLFFGLVVNKPARVGVVDIGEVMSELGISAALTQASKDIQGDIGREMQEMQKEYAAAYEALSSQAEAAEGDEGALQGQINTLQADMRRATSTLVADSQRRQQHMLAEYRARLQRYINQVAEKEGVSLVATKGSHLAYYRSSIGLTDAVIEAARPDAAKLAQSLDPEDAE
ncbi:MAG: OmpH family outer membrane protein [Verrucomicrobia bacterium]|nr:OmpH family outer membrane protein [Verrucomicrobiota bacterium]MDA1086371.1 OmpH family outer membrane protein [Verrucomicrobiota bacterium]